MPKRCTASNASAAAAAAVADEVDAFPIVLAKLHQAEMIICLMQQIDAFFLADGTGVTMFDQGMRRSIEGHADIHGGIAICAHMPVLFMAAVAQEC